MQTIVNWFFNITVHMVLGTFFCVLWNVVVPRVFGLSALTYTEAWALWTLWMGGLFAPFVLFYATHTGNQKAAAQAAISQPSVQQQKVAITNPETMKIAMAYNGQVYETTSAELIKLIQFELEKASVESAGVSTNVTTITSSPSRSNPSKTDDDEEGNVK